MKNITIYTDGACSGNPGFGGWGAVLIFGEKIKEISGFSPDATNNIMELTAPIEALQILKEKCNVDIYTDSTYVKNGITQWIFNWKKNGWKSADKKPVKNIDLWLKLDKLCSDHVVNWYWVKGHANNEFNNRADFLATEAIKNHRL